MKVKPADKNGIVYNTYKDECHVIGIDPNLFRLKYLRRRLNKKYNVSLDTWTDIEKFNPDNVDVHYLSWWDNDLQRSNDDLIHEIQKYRKTH